MNQREMEVLNIVCASENPLTSTDIVNQKKELTQSTVIAVLRQLSKCGAVEVAGVTHSGKVLSRTYSATEKAKEIMTEHYEKMLKETRHILTEKEMYSVIKEVYSND